MQSIRTRLACLLLCLPAAAAGLSAVAPTSTPTQDPTLPGPKRTTLAFRVAEHGNAEGAMDQPVFQLLDEIRRVSGLGGPHEEYVAEIVRTLVPLHDAVLRNNADFIYTWCFDPETERWIRYCHEVSNLTVCDLDDPRGAIAVELGTTIFLETY